MIRRSLEVTALIVLLAACRPGQPAPLPTTLPSAILATPAPAAPAPATLAPLPSATEPQATTAGPLPATGRPAATPAPAPSPTSALAPSRAATARPATTVPAATRVPSTSTAIPATAPPVPPTRPAATARPSPVRLESGEISIPTYPYERFLRTATDAARGGYPVQVLDRAAYEASGPQPAPVRYRQIALENEYLRLTILPDLGGRIYECIFKPTGNDELYRNPVIKPTTWGPPPPPYPAGANWWLAAGGIEWGFPVEEHGYEWASPWGYDSIREADGSMTVTVFLAEPSRPYVAVDITLAPGSAAFTLRPRITNPTSAPFKLKWWANAMLAPGRANSVGPDLRIVMPAGTMAVHSSADASLPGPGGTFSFPIYGGRDLSRLGNWTGYLGFFESPAARGDYMGVYDTVADEGMVRTYPSGIARGAKAFAVGWSRPVDWHEWTDDGSTYMELHGGLAPNFDDWYELPAGGEVTWSETWYPVAGLGRVDYASAGAALGLAPTAAGLRVSIFPVRALSGQVEIGVPGLATFTRPVSAGPERPYAVEVPYGGAAVPASGEVSVRLSDAQGRPVLSYRGDTRLR